MWSCVLVVVGVAQALHAGVIRQFIECQLIVLAPICPHFCDYAWRNILEHPASVLRAQWPALDAPDKTLLDST